MSLAWRGDIATFNNGTGARLVRTIKIFKESKGSSVEGR